LNRHPSPTQLPPGVWKAMPRLTARQKSQGLWVDPGEGCLFNYAFYDSLLVPQPEDCAPVLAHITALGDQLQYGPFLVETAVQAAMKKDWERAETYARAASPVDPVSARSDILLAGILIDTKRPEEALEVVDVGLAKAARYRHREEWTELAQLKMEAALATRDRQKVAEAERLQSCLQKHLYDLTETWCQEGIWGLL
jgi:predicted Zn-dependent protease